MLIGEVLCLFGCELVGSWFEQSLVVCCQEDYVFCVEIELYFNFMSYQQGVGLILYYNCYKFYYLVIIWDEMCGCVFSFLFCFGDWLDVVLQFLFVELVSLFGDGQVWLVVEVDGVWLQFQVDWGEGWCDIGFVLDVSVVLDEGGCGEYVFFMGVFVGMLVFDISGVVLVVDYMCFSYLLGRVVVEYFVLVWFEVVLVLV